MTLRPVDDAGDILPVLSVSSMMTGPAAVARLAASRLTLYQGEWWEAPEQGNAVLSLLCDSRLTEKDLSAVSSLLSAYVRKTPGVLGLRDVSCAFSGPSVSWHCTLLIEEGEESISLHFTTAY